MASHSVVPDFVFLSLIIIVVLVIRLWLKPVYALLTHWMPYLLNGMLFKLF